MNRSLNAVCPDLRRTVVSKIHRLAMWTYDASIGAYYFALNDRRPPPYRKQVVVTAIAHLDHEGSLAALEVMDRQAPPPPKPRSIPTQLGWVVEKGVGTETHYFCILRHQADWTADPKYALRFARQEDADAFAAIIPEEVRVAEKIWEK
jgi:hypothetical protein